MEKGVKQYPVTYVSKEDLSNHITQESIDLLYPEEMQAIANWMEVELLKNNWYEQALRVALYKVFEKKGVEVELFNNQQ
jgi:hypothetical protein